MKKQVVLLLLLFALFAANAQQVAEGKARVEIGKVIQKDSTVSFTINASKPFLFGSNMYILSIGGNEFTRYIQSKVDGKGTITFLMPFREFGALAEGQPLYLYYGSPGQFTVQDLESRCKRAHMPCWDLGNFSTRLLTK